MACIPSHLLWINLWKLWIAIDSYTRCQLGPRVLDPRRSAAFHRGWVALPRFPRKRVGVPPLGEYPHLTGPRPAARIVAGARLVR